MNTRGLKSLSKIDPKNLYSRGVSPEKTALEIIHALSKEMASKETLLPSDFPALHEHLARVISRT